MKILVTGAAGFIGFYLCKVLIRSNIKGIKIFGIDSINNYYSTKLKKDRIKNLVKIDKQGKFEFSKIDIADKKKLYNLFNKKKFDYVVNLAAQAGVRHSITNPEEYMKNNLIGFFNILEASRKYKIKHLFFASTSSVYGDNIQNKFTENANTNSPKQFYAATKKSNEVMAYSYASLFNLNITGLRFFTVYGPWGRPDMAIFKFVKNILENKKIEVYNEGNHKRSFTYVEDIAISLLKMIKKISQKKSNNKFYYQVFNIGSHKQISLKILLKKLTKILNITKIKIKYLPLQDGDVKNTKANCNKLMKYINYHPKTKIENGLKNFVRWYLDYNEINH